MSNGKFTVRKAAVLGAGVMGAQIAAHLANADVEPLLFDLASKDGDPKIAVCLPLTTNGPPSGLASRKPPCRNAVTKTLNAKPTKPNPGSRPPYASAPGSRGASAASNGRVAWIAVGIGEPEHRGRGYATEAMSLALDYAVNELNLHRIQLTVFAYNAAAIKLYERLGFTHEGTFREFIHRDGQRFDMYLYGILRREWEARNQG